jgi:hypothetical protein
MDLQVAARVHQMIRGTQHLAPLQFAQSYESTPRVVNEELASFTHRLIVRALERLPRTMLATGRT